jgi:hypothetical protein
LKPYKSKTFEQANNSTLILFYNFLANIIFS